MLTPLDVLALLLQVAMEGVGVLPGPVPVDEDHGKGAYARDHEQRDDGEEPAHHAVAEKERRGLGGLVRRNGNNVHPRLLSL